MKDILVIANGIATFDGEPNISGGDVRFLEITKRWAKMGYNIHLMSPPSGLELARRFDVPIKEFHPLNIKDGANFTSYAYRILQSGNLPKSLDNFKGYVYTSTEHIYDCIPATILAKRGNIWGGVLHFVSPLPWKRSGPLFNTTLFYLQQHVAIKLIKKYANFIFTVSKPSYDDYIKIGGKKEKSIVVECGVDLSWLEQTNDNEDKTFTYDGVALNRLHNEKGIFDLIKAWANVVKKKSDAKLAIMGDGDEDIKNEVHRLIEELEISNNVELLGPIYDIKRKFEILRSSRVFVLASHKENWGIVIGEAMTAGLPVVCYDIPMIRPIWEDSVRWAKHKDFNSISDEILVLLENEELRQKTLTYSKEFVKKYDWNLIAQKELDVLINNKTKEL